MDDDARKLESIKFAQESTKQVITLAAGIITFLFGAVSIGQIDVRGPLDVLLFAAIGMLLASIIAGVLTFFSLAGVLSSAILMNSKNPLDTSHYRLFGRGQFACFLIAMIFMGALISFWPGGASRSKTTAVSIAGKTVCGIENGMLTCVSN